jgi:hypothetical protein
VHNPEPRTILEDCRDLELLFQRLRIEGFPFVSGAIIQRKRVIDGSLELARFARDEEDLALPCVPSGYFHGGSRRLSDRCVCR